jgi:hypothetical protein
VLFVIEFAGQRHADGDAETLSERTAGHLDARQFQPMRMSLERRVEFAQSDHVFDRKISRKGQAEIECRRFVPTRPDDSVTLLPFGIIGIVIGDLEVESGDDLHHRERPAGMAGAGGAESYQVVAAHQAGGLLKFIERKVADNSFGESVTKRHDESFARVNASAPGLANPR